MNGLKFIRTQCNLSLNNVGIAVGFGWRSDRKG